MLLVLCGTNRPGAKTREISKMLVDFLNEDLEQSGTGTVKLIDLQDLPQEIYSPSSYASKPAWFQSQYQSLISAATGIVVVTPEYNGSFPGVLKYFIDMLKFPESLVGVAVAFVGVAAGQFGALRAVEQLELIFHYRRAHIFGERVFIPRVGEAMASSETFADYKSRLRSLSSSFVKFAQKSRG